MGGKRPSRKAKKRRHSHSTARTKPVKQTIQLDADSTAGTGMPRMNDGPTENAVEALENKCPANNSGTYYAFVEALNDFTAQRTDAAAFIQRLQEVFDGRMHSHLDDFLPPPVPSSISMIPIEHALQFLRKVRERLGQEHLFTFFCRVMKKCASGDPASRARHCDLARSLLGDNLDLLHELNQFLPNKF